MPLPIISVSQMREWEQATWAAGQTEADVIRRVGKAVAEVALRLTRAGDAILILAGKGHNGDDARAAQQHLKDRRVELLNVTDPLVALEELRRQTNNQPALIIDALFGIGLNRPLDANWKTLINSVNDAKIPVLSVDVPSGLNADSGEPQGAAIEAAVTLTIGAPKAGLLRPVAWPFVGRLEVAADVGLILCPNSTELKWTVHDDMRNWPPRRQAAGHKGDFGRLAILAGSMGFHGAAVLAAKGAQRARPGLITLFTTEPVYHVVASQLQAVMVNIWKPGFQFPDNATALLIGPGLADAGLPDEMKLNTRRVWRDFPSPVVVDASALDWLNQEPTARDTVRVMTPHPGEAARLLRATTKHVQADRVGALREISHRYGGCWVVLKGQQTLVGRETGEIFVNPTGNPNLAQGGSGDVLAGFIAGLLAQPALQTDVSKTLRYAVWQHGAAADALEERSRNWIVEDLSTVLGEANLERSRQTTFD